MPGDCIVQDFLTQQSRRDDIQTYGINVDGIDQAAKRRGEKGRPELIARSARPGIRNRFAKPIPIRELNDLGDPCKRDGC